MKITDIREYVASRLWIWPLVGLLGALAAAIGTLYADARLGDELVGVFATLDLITGDPDAARAILSVIAGSMISLIVFTFSLTMVVIQLASAQYSPRLTRSVLRDRPTKICLTLFMSTFAYALIVLRSVAEEPDRVVVPELSLAVTYLLVIGSLFAFIIYIDHVAQTMRVGGIIERVTAETLACIEALAASMRRGDRAAAAPEKLGEGHSIAAPRDGTLSHLDELALQRVAIAHDAVIELVPRIGDHVPCGSPLVRLHGGPVEPEEVLEHISLARERTMQQDVAFGFRQLVDVANRALSSGINDPTTAVQCIDGLHDLLRRLVALPDLPAVLADNDGRARVVIPRTRFADYVTLATSEIRISGTSAPQIPRRLEAMLEDLLAAASEERRRPLEEARRRLRASVSERVDLATDRKLYLRADRQGLGTAARN